MNGRSGSLTLWSPADIDAHIKAADADKGVGRVRSAEAGYLRALVLDDHSTTIREKLGSIGWSERHLAHLDRTWPRITDDEQQPSALTAAASDRQEWIVPAGMHVAFVTGAIRRHYRLSTGSGPNSSPRVVPDSDESPLIIPIVAMTNRISQISFPVRTRGPVRSIRFSLHRHPESPSLYAGAARLDKRGNATVLTLPIDAFLEDLTRYFVKLWRDVSAGGVSPELDVMLARDSNTPPLANPTRTEFDQIWRLPEVVKPFDEDPPRVGVLFLTPMADASQYIDAVQALHQNADVRACVLTSSLSSTLEWSLDLRLCYVIDHSARTAYASDVAGLVEGFNSHGICTIFVSSKADGEGSPAISRICHYSVTARSLAGTDSSLELRWPVTSGSAPVLAASSIHALRAGIWPDGTLPRVGVITVLRYGDSIPSDVLRAVSEQDYPGEIALILLGDAAAIVQSRETMEAASFVPQRIAVHYVTIDLTRSTAFSKLAAAVPSDADIYLCLRIETLPTADYVTSHVREHLVPLTDAVIGPPPAASRDRDEWTTEPPSGLPAYGRWDDLQLNSFLNCAHGNVSFQKRWLPQFNVSGVISRTWSAAAIWDAIEFGYQLYTAGARIRYSLAPISVQSEHPWTDSPVVPAAEIARGLDRLRVTCAGFEQVARRWLRHTAKDSRGTGSRTLSAKKRPLRIVTYAWHVPHQYEIFKLPHQFTILTDIRNTPNENWNHNQRPLRPNARIMSAREFDPCDYDLCLLHFDENCLCPDLSKGALDPAWGKSFQWLLENADLPKIAVCHGTPAFVGQYAANSAPIEKFQVMEEERQRLVNALWDCLVVCNSYQAEREWGFRRSKVIWHGIDPQEFPPGTNHLPVVSHGVDHRRPHYRGAHVLEESMKLLAPEIVVASHRHKSTTFVSPGNPQFAERSFRCWVDHLRSFRAYMNTTLRSPMPRSRTEAMMCGVVPVTTGNHDAASFIAHGVNGFLAEHAEEFADCVRFLWHHQAAADAMGREARNTALRLFNHDRFLAEWSKLFQEVAG